MDEKLKKLLGEETQPENVTRLMNDVIGWVKSSRSDMSTRYATWDRHIATYRSLREPDREDLEARKRKDPEKFIVPLSFAQVQTFVAFSFLQLNQGKFFFEFSPTGNEDFPLRDISELIIQRDLNWNTWPSKLYQFLLDLGRCGLAVTNTYWKVEKQWVSIEQPSALVGGYAQPGQSVDMEATRFEGNCIYNVSPFNFFPDTRMPLTRWRDGRFAADEQEWHVKTLEEWEAQGKAVGTKFVSRMDQGRWTERAETTRLAKMTSMYNNSMNKSSDERDFMTVVTTAQVRINPADYQLPGKPQIYQIKIANDARVLSFQPLGYLHGDFTYDVAQLSPDQHSRLNESLCDTIAGIQDVVTWLINTRLTSVRRSLDNHMVIHPSYIDMASVEARSPFILAKKGAPGNVGVDKFVSQLKIIDTTAGHFGDAEMLRGVMQFVTGVNENAMGQYAPGRRSATENRSANQGAAARMQTPLSIAWADALGPLGRKMLTNQRQGISMETYAKIVGKDPTRLALFEQFAPNDPRELVGCEDFFAYDMTTASERGSLAQSLQDLVVAMMSSPEVAMSTGFDFEKAVQEIQQLRGNTNVTRFFRVGGLAGAAVPAATVVPNAGGGQPDVGVGNPAVQGLLGVGTV